VNEDVAGRGGNNARTPSAVDREGVGALILECGNAHD
jgi:hypothetical protein